MHTRAHCSCGSWVDSRSTPYGYAMRLETFAAHLLPARPPPLPSSDEPGSAGETARPRARKPRKKRKQPRTSDRVWTRVLCLVCSNLVLLRFDDAFVVERRESPGALQRRDRRCVEDVQGDLVGRQEG